MFANADEAALVAGVSLPVLVIKDGDRPVRMLVRAREVLVPVTSVGHVVDTTGAGDAFAGGFLAATLAGAALEDAARAGIALAARTLGVAGARVARPPE